MKRIYQSVAARVPGPPKPKPRPVVMPHAKPQLPEPGPQLAASILDFAKNFTGENGFPQDGVWSPLMRSATNYFLDYNWDPNSSLSFYFDPQGNIVEIVVYRNSTRGQILQG